MSIERIVIFIAIGALYVTVIRADTDTLAYPELINSAAMEEIEEDGQTTISFHLDESIGFRTKARLSCNGFQFHYRIESKVDHEIEQSTSLQYTRKRFAAGIGYGQPHIAHGVILGNTMMRFSPALNGQAGIRPLKLNIRAYDQYKPLAMIRMSAGLFNMSLFRYNGIYAGTIEFDHKKWTGGLGCYIHHDLIGETWLAFKNSRLKASFNASISGLMFNHVSGDILYKIKDMRLFTAGVYLGKGFAGVKPDSKWGSGLGSGSRGLAGGIVLSRSPWKFSGIAYGIWGTSHWEERCMLEGRYKKRPFEITSSLIYKNINRMDDNNTFPFNRCWDRSQTCDLKLYVKIALTPTCKLITQCQASLQREFAYVGVIRFIYENNKNKIKCQLTHCCGFDHDLYFLRPAGINYYGIRKAPKDETLYLDLLYSKMIGNTEVYILLRNEGVVIGLTL